VRVLTATALAVLTVAAIFLPGAAASHTMNGSVGPGFTISLTGTAGLVPGETHTVVVDDQGTEHNFHLLGTSVMTDIVGTGTSSFQVTLAAGQYTYVCDPHASTMRGTFTVGTSPPPPAKPVRLNGWVGPGAKIDLKRGAKRATSLAAGLYLFVVSDRSALDNFHLTGPGVNRKTGVAAKGTMRWTLRLKKGLHVYRSDAHAKLRRGFAVTGVSG
jgi:plastocyanin